MEKENKRILKIFINLQEKMAKYYLNGKRAHTRSAWVILKIDTNKKLT